jgi:hypothetical protein
MTTLYMATPVSAELAKDTREAQEARWNAWKAKAAAADRITQVRLRIAVTAVVIALAFVTLAVVL